ncbi:ribonuclease HI family protein [Macrococcus hajekii]|uniref:Ribonuclease HI family protein n=1 Tax=Macrococcus hajekii TaxID=198482 RepID=A0A4R6BMG4_9STAP|nr:ribonuclease HI family protein [Macrococcus hajekii]TDM03024.1 ribonuclease HI family protein [Macrococcus hajekii]GGB05956.1 cell wall enzyme EbsB [Macrococcus hajekii]
MAQIFIDAATRQNPFESSIGYVIRTDESVLEFGQYLGEMENHEAEWNGLIEALKQAVALNLTSVILKSDSKIVVDSINKNFVKNPKFKPYLKEYQQLEKQFDLLIIDWIPRDQNKHADHVARHYLKQQ